MASKVQRRAASESLVFLLIIGGILVLINVLASMFPVGRVDLTRNKLFSLADGSKAVAAGLSDRMSITAYFTEGLPPPFNSTERHVRDLLAEYAAASNGNVVVQFVNPDNDEKQGEARSDGIQAVAHQKVDDDQVSVVEGYRGLVMKYLDAKKTIPVIQDTTGLEYTLTSAMKELTGEKKPVGIVKGHDSPTLEQGLSALKDVLPLYDLQEVDASEEIDPGFATLLIVGPALAFTDAELRRINQYVMRGGSLGIFGGSMKVDLSSGAPAGQPVATELNKLLEPWGVKLRNELIADSQCTRAPMRGPLGLQVLVPYPPIPVLQLDDEQSEHPVMFRLASPSLPFVAPLDLSDAPDGVSLSALARSSENSWAMSGSSISLQPKQPRDWQISGRTGPFDLAAALEGPLPSAFLESTSDPASKAIEAPEKAENARVLVFGTSTFLEDTFQPRQAPNAPVQLNAALSLGLNAVDWLAADADLIAVRAKTIEEPALDIPDSVLAAEDAARAAAEQRNEEGVKDALEERKAAISSWSGKKVAYRWLNTLGIPILVALFGVIRWRSRLNKKRTLEL